MLGINSKYAGSFRILLALLLLAGFSTCAKRRPTLPTERAVFHNNQGVSFLASGDIERARFEFLTAVELNPNYAEAHNNLGITFKELGQLDKAIRSFLRALKIEPDFASAHNHLGALYLAQGKIEEAIAEIKKAIKRDPTLADAHYNLGLVWYEKAKKEGEAEGLKQAEVSWKRATELDPNLEHVHLRLAELYREQGRFELATIRYRLALGTTSDTATWVRLGSLYLEKGDTTRAQNAFQKAIESDPNSAEAHMHLGSLYADQRRFEEAGVEFQAATEIDPRNEMAFFRLGAAKIAQAEGGDAASWTFAIAALTKAKELNPHFSDATYNLGYAWLKKGDLENARAEWEHTLRITPKHARTLYNLATLDQHEGRKAAATRHFCDFLAVEGGKYPMEVQIAKQVLSQTGAECQN